MEWSEVAAFYDKRKYSDGKVGIKSLNEKSDWKKNHPGNYGNLSIKSGQDSKDQAKKFSHWNQLEYGFAELWTQH